MERRDFITGSIVAVLGWFGLNQANAQGPVRNIIKRLRTSAPGVWIDRLEPSYVIAPANPTSVTDHIHYRQARQHIGQVVGFTIIIMIVIWIIEMIIEWLIWGKKALSPELVIKINHLNHRARELETRAVERGCKVGGEFNQSVRDECK